MKAEHNFMAFCALSAVSFLLLLQLPLYVLCDLSQPPSSYLQFHIPPPLPFSSRFSNLWASDHQDVYHDDLSVSLTLDQRSGSGFKSNSQYLYGLFSAAIKLPANYSAGVVTTFYTSNNKVYEATHDEIDFEFLGVVPGERYVLQTNVYGNGSTNIGREQRFHLWFDPTSDFHQYTILWNPNHTVFFVDGLPIRQYRNMEQLGSEYPSKPMFVYGTIWDASAWATDGGNSKINFSFAPFTATYTDLVVTGCETAESGPPVTCLIDSSEQHNFKAPVLTRHQEIALQWARKNYMIYDYCSDTKRYPQKLPECN